MFGRPIPIWLILAFLAYAIVGTAKNLLASLSGEVSYGTVSLIFGILSLSANIWLFVEVWRRLRRQSLAAFCNLALFGLMYGQALIAPVKMRDMDQIVAVLMLAGMMTALWLAIALYLRRHQAKSS